MTLNFCSPVSVSATPTGIRHQAASPGRSRVSLVCASVSAALVSLALVAPSVASAAPGATGAKGAPAATAVDKVPGRTDVTIKRDEFGVPHIYASTTYALFYGYGYAIAQDRLFQMEMARRSTQGTVAEVLGEKFVDFDKSIRGNYWPASIRRQLADLPQRERDILDGYAAGMNAWIAQIRAKPDQRMPRQFNDFGFQPTNWDAFDVAMVFVGTMANRFSDATSEIDNLALVTALKDKYGAQKGMALFNELKWIVNPDAPSTVAPRRSKRSTSSHRDRAASSRRTALARRTMRIRWRCTRRSAGSPCGTTRRT